MLSLHVSPGEWSSPNITGQPPPSCSHFTLTQVDERRAALLFVSSVFFSDLFVVELSRHTVVSVVRKQYCIKVFMLNFAACWLIFIIEASKMHDDGHSNYYCTQNFSGLILLHVINEIGKIIMVHSQPVNIYVSTHTHARMHTCTHAHMHGRMHAWAYARTDVHTHAHTHVYLVIMRIYLYSTDSRVMMMQYVCTHLL